jgi:hypothetical protein
LKKERLFVALFVMAMDMFILKKTKTMKRYYGNDPQEEPKYTNEEIEEMEANEADNKYDESRNFKTQENEN